MARSLQSASMLRLRSWLSLRPPLRSLRSFPSLSFAMSRREHPASPASQARPLRRHCAWQSAAGDGGSTGELAARHRVPVPRPVMASCPASCPSSCALSGSSTGRATPDPDRVSPLPWTPCGGRSVDRRACRAGPERCLPKGNLPLRTSPLSAPRFFRKDSTAKAIRSKPKP